MTNLNPPNLRSRYLGAMLGLACGAAEAVESCQFFAAMLCAALTGVEKAKLFDAITFNPSQAKLVELVSGAFRSVGT